MMVYPSFIYLQNHKTGCTFVETYLRKFCIEPLLKYEKHAVLKSKTDKFCFVNVREPLSLYRSLFTYGLDKKGFVYHRLCRMGHGSLYENGPLGFSDWLDFVHRPENAPLLADNYRQQTAEWLGFMTWRFLRLACPGFDNQINKTKDFKLLSDWIDHNWTLDSVVRQETIRDDMVMLTQGSLAHTIPYQSQAVKWLRQSKPINTSHTNANDIDPPASLLDKIYTLEAYIYQRFYTEDLSRTISDMRSGTNGIFVS
jgi:hypothetical protein